jgi:hypothetical protein
MANPFSVDDLLEFLDHAGDRGLMPAATAGALAVASRNVFGVLSDDEKADLSTLDIDGVIKRFNNKRAKDFNPASLKEYGRRVKRALDLFLRWREDPATFTVKTRSTTTVKRPEKARRSVAEWENVASSSPEASVTPTTGAYSSSVPVRPGVVVTVANIPNDLTKAEADRLATFVRMLAID